MNNQKYRPTIRNYSSKYMESYTENSISGIDYDNKVENRFELAIFELEKKILEKILKNYLSIPLDDVSYLDYACGTGRIISVFGKIIKKTIGIDTSIEQINVAKEKVPKVHFLLGNLAVDDNLVPSKSMNLITCFRLFLNIEKNNRNIILLALKRKLLDDGILIVDIHMNRFSILGIIALFLRKVFKVPDKRSVKPGKRGIIGTLSELEFRRELKEAGFKILKVYRIFLIPGHGNYVFMPTSLLIKIENILSKVPIINLMSKNLIFVCAKKKE